MSFSDTIQQSWVVKCIFYCLIVACNFVQKSERTCWNINKHHREGGLYFSNVHPMSTVCSILQVTIQQQSSPNFTYSYFYRPRKKWLNFGSHPLPDYHRHTDRDSPRTECLRRRKRKKFDYTCSWRKNTPVTRQRQRRKIINYIYSRPK